jgi:hypothetical protein
MMTEGMLVCAAANGCSNEMQFTYQLRCVLPLSELATSMVLAAAMPVLPIKFKLPPNLNLYQNQKKTPSQYQTAISQQLRHHFWSSANSYVPNISCASSVVSTRSER